MYTIIFDSHGDGTGISDEHNEFFPAGDPGIEQIPLEEQVMLCHQREDNGLEFASLGFMYRYCVSKHELIHFIIREPDSSLVKYNLDGVLLVINF